MAKSPDAFRTISEVADWLGIQAHVLRFWESKFSQVKPIKRAGGRRYYRPTDMLLLGGIKKLLHDDGLTIKGVQKILREQGMNHVADMSAPLDDDTLAQLDDVPTVATPAPVAVEEEEKGVVLTFEPPVDEQEPAEETADAAEPATAQAPQDSAEMPQGADTADDVDAPQMHADDATDADASSQPEEDAAEDDTAPQLSSEADSSTKDEASPEETTFAGEDEEHAATLPAFLQRPLDPLPADAADEQAPEPVSEAPEEIEPVAAAPEQTDTAEPMPEVDADTAADSAAPAEDAPVAAEPAPKPRVIDVPAVPAEADIDAAPGLLAATYARKTMSSAEARDVAPLLARLASLRDNMNAQRRNNGVSS